MFQWDPFILTFKLATVTTVILFFIECSARLLAHLQQIQNKICDRGAGKSSVDLASVRAWLLFIIGV